MQNIWRYLMIYGIIARVWHVYITTRFAVFLLITWRKYPISVSIRPADNLPHLFQCQLLHEHEDRSNLIGKPAMMGGSKALLIPDWVYSWLFTMLIKKWHIFIQVKFRFPYWLLVGLMCKNWHSTICNIYAEHVHGQTQHWVQIMYSNAVIVFQQWHSAAVKWLSLLHEQFPFNGMNFITNTGHIIRIVCC